MIKFIKIVGTPVDAKTIFINIKFYNKDDQLVFGGKHEVISQVKKIVNASVSEKLTKKDALNLFKLFKSQMDIKYPVENYD